MTQSPPARSIGSEAGSETLPRVFGRYVLFDRVGQGGMADIYLARADTELGGSRRVVVKQILPELTRDEAFVRMFIAEAKLAAGLRHANVVQVFDLGREGERLFIGMEYVEGFDLHQLLRELSRARVALPAQFALFLVREVLSGLAYAHRARLGEREERGIVHRDVSPSNVLISFEGEVKLCDFGIARALTERGAMRESDLTPAPAVVGKSAYMSPEQALGEPVDARADLFAAGILAWELCAGRRLYKGTEEQMLKLAREARVPPLPDRGLPRQDLLQAWLDRALAPDRGQRFETAEQMQRALDDYARETGLFASQLRFGAFLTEHFGEQIVSARRAHERAAEAYTSNWPAASSAAEVSAVETLPPQPAAAGPYAVSEADSAVRERHWREPGSLSQPPRPSNPASVEVSEPGRRDTHGPAVLGADSRELEVTLDALCAADDATPGHSMDRPRTLSGRPVARRLTVASYAAVVFIAASGLAWYWWG